MNTERLYYIAIWMCLTYYEGFKCLANKLLNILASENRFLFLITVLILFINL